MNKSVLITGASSGIGLATAKLLVNGGAKVALFARSEAKLAAVVEELGASNAVAIAGDVTVQADVERAVSVAAEKFGQLDAVFGNAGQFNTSPLAEGDPEVWAQMIDVNIMGVLRVIRAVLPAMIARGSGDIVLTSSTAGRIVYPGGAVYAATKHAVYAIAEGLRKEIVHTGVRVGVVSPGRVANEIWGITDPAESRRQADLGEALTSEDVASAVVHILSQPQHVNIVDMLVIASRQETPGM